MSESDNKRIYMDYAATTPIDDEVFTTMLPYFGKAYSNPSSMHKSGRMAGQAIKKSREIISSVLKCEPSEIIFTGSGTEADNMAMVGIAKANKAFGNHIIVSAIEHKAILEPAKELEKEGFKLSILPVQNDGSVDVDKCINMITDKTILISVMYANNEIGTIQPIKELAEKIKSFRKDKPFPILHTDACQAVGALTLNTEELGVDMMTINSSKIYGPKGVGALFKKKHILIKPLISGGEQESNLRAGTENVALIVGFAEALKKADSNKKEESARLTELRDYFSERILKDIPGSILNGNPKRRLPNNIHISIPHIEGESILLMLDNLGIEASTGSACSAYDLKPSHVLLAIGQDPEFAHGSIRFSLGKETTHEQIDKVMEVFPKIALGLKNISALTTNALRK